MAEIKDVLREAAIQIRDEHKLGANTAKRVGSLLLALVDAGLNLEDLKEIFLSKTQPDIAQELIIFLKGLLIGENGSGITVLENGMSQAVVDYLYVKIKAVFDELEVKKKTYVGGEQVLSPAGMKCIRVEGQADAYRCYFKAEEDGVEIENRFTVGTLAIAQECNIKVGVSHHVGNRYYWRAVTTVGTDYIDLSKTHCDPNIENDLPAAGDDIVALGHLTDITRQGAIILSSVNEVAPSILMYQGINDFTLAGKESISLDFDKSTGRARMKVYGDAYIGARDRSSYIEYTQDGLEVKAKKIVLESGDSLDDKLDNLQVDVDAVKAQSDNEYTLWFFDYAPALNNVPASDWNTPELRAAHEQDMFYNRSTGLAYRFEKDEDSNYAWNPITDQQTIKALENAAKAQDTADGKRRIFVEQPTNASVYDIGDMWVTATYPAAAPYTYENDSLVCKTAKTAGAAFSIDHWKPASNATTATIKNLGDSILLTVAENDEQVRKLVASAQATANSAGTLANAAGTLAGTANDTANTANNTANAAKEQATANATAIVQTNKDISVVSGRFNSDGTLKNTSGLVTGNGTFASLFASAVSADGDIVKKADIRTFITEDAAGKLISNATIQADKINFIGKTIINDNFVVAANGDLTLKNMTAVNGKFTGEVNATTGKIAGLKVSGNSLTNEGFNNDAYIILRNDPNKTFAGIGGSMLPATAGGVQAVARFENNRSIADTNNIALYCEAGGASGYGKNYALWVAKGQVWMPGVLFGGTIQWPASNQDIQILTRYNFEMVGSVSATGSSNSGYIQINHNLGHTNYFVIASSYGGETLFTSVADKTSGSFKIYIFGRNGGAAWNKPFSFAVIGMNSK